MVALSVVAAPSVVRGFTTIQQARHGFTPNRIRAPTDWRFASGCFPPCLAADAVAFSYTVTTHYGGDFHPADKASSQTHWMAGTSPAMTLNPSGTSPMLPNLSSPTANAISARNVFLNSLTENQNYGIVTYRWTKGASRADGKRPSRLAWRNRRDKLKGRGREIICRHEGLAPVRLSLKLGTGSGFFSGRNSCLTSGRSSVLSPVLGFLARSPVPFVFAREPPGRQVGKRRYESVSKTAPALRFASRLEEPEDKKTTDQSRQTSRRRRGAPSIRGVVYYKFSLILTQRIRPVETPRQIYRLRRRDGAADGRTEYRM